MAGLFIMYTVYVLYSFKYNKIYVGYTNDLANRFSSHNELSNKGWTIKYRPWVIAYKEVFKEKPEAIKREKQLKTATGRKFIREQVIAKLSIQGSYPPAGGPRFDPWLRNK